MPLVKNYQVGVVLRNQFVGLEDLVNGTKNYSVSAICEKDAEVLYMSKQDYLKLQNNSAVWSGLQTKAEENLHKLAETILNGQLADFKITTRMFKAVE